MIPAIDDAPPTFRFFSIPTPPSVTIEPVSLSVDSVLLFTKIELFISVLPIGSITRFPVVVSILLSYILTLSNVPTPVTFRLLILTWVSNVEIPLTFKRLSVVDW